MLYSGIAVYHFRIENRNVVRFLRLKRQNLGELSQDFSKY